MGGGWSAGRRGGWGRPTPRGRGVGAHPLPPPQNGTLASVADLVAGLNEADAPAAVEVVAAPTFLHLASVAATLRPDWATAAQDAHPGGPGAFTGQVPAEAVADAGAAWVIVGHSERRARFGDSDALVAAKARKCLDLGLSVILCVGESLAQREAGDAAGVVCGQLKAAVDGAPLAEKDWPSIVLAYEPVWAIGTGKVATPVEAQEMHAAVRGWLAAHVSRAAADATRVMYGGSVTPASAGELAACADVDGFLVGGASLQADAFAAIVRAGGAV